MSITRRQLLAGGVAVPIGATVLALGQGEAQA